MKVSIRPTRWTPARLSALAVFVCLVCSPGSGETPLPQPSPTVQIDPVEATLQVPALVAAASVSERLTPAADLPEAPGPQTAPAPAATASCQGVVRDLQGNPVPAAAVTLSAPGLLGRSSTVAAADGSFSFPGVLPGQYRLIVTAPGMGAYTSSEFTLRPGDTFTADKIALPVAQTSTSVTVYATQDQIATAQVQEQEKQRVLGVFPNFYTSYIWDAEPMPARQKYKLAFRALIDPVNFFLVAGIAGAEQYNGTYPGYGPGIQGYGKRYGAAYADGLTSRLIGSAILPSLFHQDPRYFYQGSGGVKWRTVHAIASTVVTRGDSGKLQPNYSHILGSLAAGAIANTYHPDSSKGLGLTFETLGITTAANAAGNLIREFVLRGLVPSVPTFAKGK